MDNDLRIIIANGTHVFSHGTSRIATLSPSGGAPLEANPEMVIARSDRGSSIGVEVTTVQSMIAAGDDSARIEKEFLDVLRNAVAVARLNVSLALRDALDTILDDRASHQRMRAPSMRQPNTGTSISYKVTNRMLWARALAPATREGLTWGPR